MVAGGRVCVRLAVFALLAVAGFLTACGGGSRSSSPSGSNVQSIAVDGGPVAGLNYADAAFTSVTVCVPGSSNCDTVGGILVDTGSVGLRLLASAIPSVSLPELSASTGATYYNCVSFVDGSYLWGPVVQADIKMAGETASSSSIQLIEDPSGFSVPTACSNGGVNEDNLQGLGANGILGVGSYPQDCGSACQASTEPDVYFTCGASGPCSSATITVSQQVTNPVVQFASDNNGVIIEMQSVDGEAATATGSLIFGIGTQSNNGMGAATVFPLNDYGFFTTNFDSQTLNESFIDSGSNGYFFPDSSITQCSANSIAPGFYCPGSPLGLSAENVGGNGSNNTVSFTVDNAVNDLNDFSSDSAFANLAGSNFTATCTAQSACGFDWGLPFFYGRSVFVSIEGQPVPGDAPAAPWWAY